MEAYYISIYMEKSCFVLVIHDEIKGMSYNYKNLKYKDDKTEVALAGYYFSRKNSNSGKPISHKISLSVSDK